MPPHPLSVAVVRALGALVDEGAVSWHGRLPDAAEADDARVRRGPAGYASSLPLRLSARVGLPAPRLAELLAARLADAPGVQTAAAAGPGYLEVEPDAATRLRDALTSASRTAAPISAVLDPLPAGPLPDELQEAVAEVGQDAVRLALARRTTGTGRLDLAVLGRADERNPGYAVLLAHARLSGVIRQGADLGVHPAAAADVDPRLLGGAPEAELVAAVADAQAVHSRAVRLGRADLVSRHLDRAAEATHRLLTTGRVLPRGDEEPGDAHRARLRLAVAARDTLATGLDLLGVTAPGRM